MRSRLFPWRVRPGLSAAVIARDPGEGPATAERKESGIVHNNDPTVHDGPQVAFGGVKHSGLGPVLADARPSRSLPSCGGSAGNAPCAIVPAEEAPADVIDCVIVTGWLRRAEEWVRMAP
jgi:hypothetical protein